LHIIHSFNERKIDEHAHREAGFLITNKKGNYLSLGKENFSHMQGLQFFDSENWEYYKTLEDIKLQVNETHDETSSGMISIKNNLSNVQRIYKGGAEESFNLFNNSMVYSVAHYTGELVLELDFRPMFDFDDKGRIYSVTREDGCIIIKYDKFTDNSLSRIDKTRFLAIKGAESFRHIGEWVKKDYAYDDRRKSHSEFYVYKALAIDVRGSAELVFSFADTKEKAKEHAENMYEDKHYMLSSFNKYATHTFTSEDLATNVAMKSLDDLLTSTERKERGVGIFAGLPWFYQFWARDELVSLKALMLQDKHYLVKSILLKHLNAVSPDGLLQNKYPASPGDAKSIDAIGWLFFRLNEFIHLLEEKKLLQEYMPEVDLILAKRVLEAAIHRLLNSHSANGLIINNEQETWMDTKPAKRSGACIEIQALFLSMLNLHSYLAKLTKTKQLFKAMEKDYKERVRSEFLHGVALYDSLLLKENGFVPSDTIRPNIFLAYYIYPDFLAKKEWKPVFDTALKALWLDWGGLTTLNYTNPLFRSEYSGAGDESYHNGDSWFYVNNYAAIAMNRLDKDYYSKYIHRIMHASKEELLFSGFIGCCAEVSSAKHMRSEGCLSQAWSVASLIEFLHEAPQHRHSHC
jgi:glycogen debranching enzyme